MNCEGCRIGEIRRCPGKLDECRFWVHLEFRLGAEFAGLPERKHQFLWCDGLEPEEYELAGQRPVIRGRAIICDGPHVEDWTFRLILPRPLASREAIDWDELLPAHDVTKWMSFSKEDRWIEIEPGAAVPDLKPD